MSEISKLIAEIKSEGILRAGNKLEHLYSLAEQKEKDYAALQQKLDAMADKLARSEDYSFGVDSERMEYIEKCNAMAAENAALKSGITYFACGSEYGFDLFRDKQAAIDVCLEEIDLHREGYLDGYGWDDSVGKTAWGIVIQSAQGRDAQGIHESEAGHTYQTCDYRLEDEVKTPATDDYLNSVRADAIPEGYVLVPQSMNISADAMESICFHGGDGGGKFGEFTEVILWVGAIENDEGTKTYGLNITTAEYPEEGSASISEFAEPIGSGTHATADKAGV